MIRLNFLPFDDQNIPTTIYRRFSAGEREEGLLYYSFANERGERVQYEIAFTPTTDFEMFELSALKDHSLIAKKLYHMLVENLPRDSFFIKRNDFNNRKIHFPIEKHAKGKKCVWIEPYFLKSKGLWGILIDYKFVVDTTEEVQSKFQLDKDILIASGTLNIQGNANTDFYLFKHRYYLDFIKKYLAQINNATGISVCSELLPLESFQLQSKIYAFGNGNNSNSSYMGLSKNIPLKGVNDNSQYYFMYRKDNRDIAVSLLRGLRGETSPTTFSGFDKLFKSKFTNDVVKGNAVDDFSDETIEKEIAKIKALGENVIPIIITNSKKEEEDEKLYYRLKHKFTNASIPCQVVTRELVQNEYTLKYSLSNIGLQIFAKAGGQPWKMKSANPDYLIIGIGQSYNVEKNENDTTIEKNITYSVLTDSSGIFKDIQVLGEGIEDDNYYEQLVTNLVNIISSSSYKKVAIHCPFRISKTKVLEKIVGRIPADTELNVLVINNKSDFFGFDYDNNGLVPFESTYIKISSEEFLLWFEGLQYNNPKITKRFGNPLLIRFWFTNRPELYNNYKAKETLLQDCINLSGANWRGFKAKQLPVSVYYCQRIAEFIAKFKQYQLEHIEISNLKPWFL